MRKKYEFGYIYLIKNDITNDIVYVGKTCNPHVRFKYYHQLGATGIKEEIKKYGKENFSYEILVKIKYDKNKLALLEDFFTIYYREQGCPLCNKIVGCHTEFTKEIRDKISKSRKGKRKGIKFTEEHCRKISEGQKGRIQKESTKKILREKKSIKVQCVETGEIFNCLADVCKAYHTNAHKQLKENKPMQKYHWIRINPKDNK